MKKENNSDGSTLKIFAETLELEARRQIEELCKSEAYAGSKVRVMPDAHAGKGCTVGLTMTISDKVTPNLVGVDIGCGVTAVRLKDEHICLDELDAVINNFIPSGFSVHSEAVHDFDFSGLKCKNYVDINRAALSIGTLGGGNHFIELGVGRCGEKYLMVHSGSRKLGGDVCRYYQWKAASGMLDKKLVAEELVARLKAQGRDREISKEIKKLKFPKVDKDSAYLTGSDLDDYLNDMSITQSFAAVNRGVIADTIIREAGLSEFNRIDTIHNYIDFDRMILRKGAVSAEAGETLVIPINMRDGTLLCIGQGEEDWNYSAPHGAGRIMSRKKARKRIRMEDFAASMDGIYTTSVCEETIDEAPQAYKPIDEIIRLIRDTVVVVDIIKPLYNFKAH